MTEPSVRAAAALRSLASEKPPGEVTCETNAKGSLSLRLRCPTAHCVFSPCAMSMASKNPPRGAAGHLR